MPAKRDSRDTTAGTYGSNNGVCVVTAARGTVHHSGGPGGEI